MSRLTRVSQPIFAGNTTDTDEQIAVFGSMKTSAVYTTNLATLLASAEYKGGWADSVVVGYGPFLEEMNGVQYGFSYQLAYNQQEGIPEWSGSTVYYIGSLAKVVTSTGCRVYSSKTDNNSGNNVSDTNNWKLVFDSDITYASMTDLSSLQSNAVLKTTNQTIDDVKTFSSSPLVPTPSTSDNSTKAANTAWVRNYTNIGQAQPAPNYGSAVSVPWGSAYTCPANGYIRIRAKARDNSYAYLRISSTSGTILWQHGDYGGASIACGIVPVNKGLVVVAHGGSGDQSATFYYGRL